MNTRVKQRRSAHADAVAAQVAVSAVQTTQPEDVGVYDLPAIDPSGMKIKNAKRIKNFSEWIEKVPPYREIQFGS